MPVNMHILRCLGLVVLVLYLQTQDLFPQKQIEGSLIEQIAPSIVMISSPKGSGTGSIIESSVYVMTNRHIVEGQYEFTISILEDPNRPAVPAYRARLFAFSPVYDFAILKIVTDLNGSLVRKENRFILNGQGNPLFPEIARASEDYVVQRGDEIGILGYPGIGESELVYTAGIISSVRLDEAYGEQLPVWYRTNADMAPGNSGGIAINRLGQIIGIPTFVMTESRTGGRLGSILPIQLINKIVEMEDFLFSWDDRPPQQMTYGHDILDYQLEPNYGEVWLDDTQEPALFSMIMAAGGATDASYLGGDCIGYVTEAPDLRLYWEGNTKALAFAFNTDNSGEDPTLLINLPDGSWRCNDDAFETTLDPMIIIDEPQSGQYDIWLGNFNGHDDIFGNLIISDFNAIADYLDSGGFSETGLPNLDFTLTPTYGVLHLSENFSPDPYVASATSGGSIDVAELSLGINCLGFASAAPDFSLNWTGSTQNLIIRFKPLEDETDTVLIINTPDGQWICNDDEHSYTLNPGIHLKDFGEGRYDIWIASYNKGEMVEGMLIMTERR